MDGVIATSILFVASMAFWLVSIYLNTIITSSNFAKRYTYSFIWIFQFLTLASWVALAIQVGVVLDKT